MQILTLARRSEAMLIENYLYTTIVWRHSSVTMETMTPHCPDQWKIPYSENTLFRNQCSLHGVLVVALVLWRFLSPLVSATFSVWTINEPHLLFLKGMPRCEV